MRRSRWPGGLARPRPRSLRAGAAMSTVFTAVVLWTLVASPTATAVPDTLCALPRSDVHHSEGVETWNPDYPRPRHTLDVLMLFLSFPDRKPGQTPLQVAADHFPATSRFFEEASYGRFGLRAYALNGWLRMPETSTAYRIRRDWSAERRTRYLRDAVAAADPHVDFSRFAVVYLVADPGAPGVDSDATKVVNLATPIEADGTDIRRLVTVFETHPPDRNVLAHETAHAFDLPDLYFRPPAGRKGDWDTHVGDWDLMGSQFGLAPELFAWHKWKLGWLDPGQVACVDRVGTSWHDITPVEVPGGTQLVAVRTGADSVLAIEARQALGNDRHVCRQGVLLYRVRSDVESGEGPVDVLDGHPGSTACDAVSVFPPLADAPLGVGESYTYREGGARVTVTGRTASGAWTVKVTKE